MIKDIQTRLMLLHMVYISLTVRESWTQKWGTRELVYEWSSLQYEWPSEKELQEAKDLGTYIPKRNLIAGIKIYKDDLYLTVPRWFFENGNPATLVKVVNVTGLIKLRPYPDWTAQKQGNCEALQYVQGMAIDSNTGLMYVIDTGRIGGTLNLCPPKIIIYNLNTNSKVLQYKLPADVASPTSNFLNDLVLDYVDGVVRYLYITDAGDARIVVFDIQAKRSFTVKDETMGIESAEAENVTISGKTYNIPVPLDGIAMSPDFKYVYYCSLAGFNLYQIPTSSLRAGKTDGIRLVGRKISQSGGIGFGSNRLYYGALELNAVYAWDIETDMKQQKKEPDSVTLKTELLLVQDNEKMQWPDTFAFDNKGWIWFVSNRVQEFRDAPGIRDNASKTMRVWKVFVNETGYLYNALRERNEEVGSGNGAPHLQAAVGASLIVWLIKLAAFIETRMYRMI